MKRSLYILLSLALFTQTLVASEEAPDVHPPTAAHLQTRNNIYTAMRITGIATVAGLATLIGILVHRERKRHAGNP